MRRKYGEGGMASITLWKIQLISQTYLSIYFVTTKVERGVDRTVV